MSNLENRVMLRLCLVLLAFALASPAIFANELMPGETLPPDLLTAGGNLLASINGNITVPTFATDYTEWVYADPNNVFCAGCLDFVYQFANLGPGIIERFTSTSFAGFRVDAGYDAASGTHVPISVDRTTSGAVVGFNYTGADTLQPGDSTVLLIIQTNATGYTDGFVTAQDGTAGSGPGYAPSAVPEPASLSMLGTGLLVAGRMLLRRLS